MPLEAFDDITEDFSGPPEATHVEDRDLEGAIPLVATANGITFAEPVGVEVEVEMAVPHIQLGDHIENDPKKDVKSSEEGGVSVAIEMTDEEILGDLIKTDRERARVNVSSITTSAEQPVVTRQYSPEVLLELEAMAYGKDANEEALNFDK